jgi:DNA-binding NarL/FixJ family response regulator
MLTGANMTADISRIRTMVVDDSPKFLRTVCSFLSQFKDVDVVATANNAGEALRAVDRLRPDLVLLDFHMPLVNGLEAMELIRRRSPATRVVIITGYDSAELREASLESGALAFIPKLYVSRELPHLLAQIAASISSEQIR